MAQRHSGYDPIARDLYLTDEPAIDALLSVVTFRGGIWEPAAADGQVARWLVRKAGVWVEASDSAPARNPVFTVQPRDFLECTTKDCAPNIVTNPPYGQSGKLAVAFIERALSIIAKTGGQAAMLLPIAFDTRKSRKHLFDGQSCHYTKIILTERLRWRNLPQDGPSPSQHHCWHVWRAGHSGGARIVYV